MAPSFNRKVEEILRFASKTHTKSQSEVQQSYNKKILSKK